MFEDDRAIDSLELKIDRGVLGLLALGAPVAEDLRQTIAIKTVAVDLERVGDLARNIAESALRLTAENAPQVTPDQSNINKIPQTTKRKI